LVVYRIKANILGASSSRFRYRKVSAEVGITTVGEIRRAGLIVGVMKGFEVRV
jgi:hypothetical protein